MAMPTKEKINKFLEIVDKLVVFEAQARATRGWGAFSKRDLEEDSDTYLEVFGWLSKFGE